MKTLCICIVGMGRHGRGCFLALQWLANSGLLRDLKLDISFCSSNKQVRSGNWKGLLTPNLGIDFPNDGIIDLTDVTIFEKPEDVVAEVVWICSPTSEHRRMAEYFLGKNIHVILEKPVALNLPDAQAVLAAARRSKASLMIAQELIFFGDFAFLFVQKKLGNKLVHLELVRQISVSDETAGAGNVSKFGGPGIDLHIHDDHLIRLLLGMPKALTVQGVGSGDYLAAGTTVYEYDQCRVTSRWGVSDEVGFNFRHGFWAQYENGVQIHYCLNVFDGGQNCFAMPPMTMYVNGEPSLVTLPAQEEPDGALGALVRQLQEAVKTVTEETGRAWIDASTGWRPSSPLCPTLGVGALELCLLERKSWQTGQRVVLS